MENLKPTQNHKQEQPTPEYDVVKNFPTDTTNLDNARYPLTIIRSGQDGEDVKHDGGWNPIGMLVVCDTDSEKGIGPIKLLMEVYKLVGADIKTEFVLLEDIQGLEANEDYIKYLYGKTTEEMIEEGKRAARDIWNQKHPVDKVREPLFTEATLENRNDSPTVESGSDHEISSADKVSPVMRGVAVEAAGVRELVGVNKVDTNEPVKRDETGAGSSTLVMTEEVMASIGAIKVNDPGSLVATEIVREEPVETDRASADLVDLPAVEPVKKPVETNEVNIGMLLEGFKDVIDNFEKHTRDNNNQFADVTRGLTGSLSELRKSIERNPAALKNSRITEFVKTASSSTREFEASRAESVNKFKNDVSGLVEELKKKIENDDERRRRLIKLTEDADEMSVGSTALGSSTNTLIGKLTEIVRIVSDAQNDKWGMDGYISRIVTVINEIVDSDLPSVNGRRQSILAAIEAIKAAEG